MYTVWQTIRILPPNHRGNIYVPQMQLLCPTVSERSQSMLFRIEMPVTQGMQTWLFVRPGIELRPTYPKVFVFIHVNDKKFTIFDKNKRTVVCMSQFLVKMTSSINKQECTCFKYGSRDTASFLNTTQHTHFVVNAVWPQNDFVPTRLVYVRVYINSHKRDTIRIYLNM